MPKIKPGFRRKQSPRWITDRFVLLDKWELLVLCQWPGSPVCVWFGWGRVQIPGDFFFFTSAAVKVWGLIAGIWSCFSGVTHHRPLNRKVSVKSSEWDRLFPSFLTIPNTHTKFSYSLMEMNPGCPVPPHYCAMQMSESHSRLFPVMFATFFSLVTVLSRSIFSHHARVIGQAPAQPLCHLSAWHTPLQSMCCVSYLPGCFRVWIDAEEEKEEEVISNPKNHHEF